MIRSVLLIAAGVVLTTAPLAASSFGASEALPSIADIVEKASPSVVNIVSESRPKSHAASPLEMLFGLQGRNNVIPRRGEGSGFVVDAKGLILTSHHVVDEATSLSVTMSNGRKYKAKILAADPTHDIAVLKLEDPIQPALTPEQVAKLGDSDKDRVGDWVLAIGSPFSLQKTVTKGIISGKGRHLTIQGKQYLNLLQTDALINPGNSGGPLLNLSGEVIGINVAINPNAQGIGFAIPINTVKRIADDLIAHGRYRETWLGVNIAQLTEEQSRSFGVGDMAGVLVQRVLPGGPAAKAGLKPGDLVTKIGDTAVENPVDLKLKIESMQAGQATPITVMRGGKQQVLSIAVELAPDDATLRDTDEETPADDTRDTRASGLAGLGLKGHALTPADRDRLELPAEARGVILTDIDESSRAAALGLAVDDVIVWVNGKEVDGPALLESQLKASANQTLLMKVWRRGALLFLQASF